MANWHDSYALMIEHGVGLIYVIDLASGRVTTSVPVSRLPEHTNWDSYDAVKDQVAKLFVPAPIVGAV